MSRTAGSSADQPGCATAIAALLALALIGWSAGLALILTGAALTGSRLVDWGSDPVVWWGELLIAALCALLAVAVIVGAARWANGRSGVEATGAVGLGFLIVGALGIVAGWLGLRAPTTPGYDVLERGEPLYIIGGLVAVALGALVVFASLIAMGLGGSGADTEQGTDTSDDEF